MSRASLLLALGLLLTSGACQCRSQPPAAAPPPPPSLHVGFAGCAAVTSGPVCELPGDRRLRLWVEVPKQVALSVSAGGARLPVEEREVRGGRACTFVVPAGATEVVLAVSLPQGPAVWRLPVRNSEQVPLLQRATALRAEGKAEDAAKLLREETPALPEVPRTRAKSLLARVELSLGHAEEAAAHLRESMALHRLGGRRSDEASDAMVLVYTLIHHGRRFTDAREVLEAVGSMEGNHPEGGAQRAYHEGLLALESGDVGAALQHFAEAELLAERLGIGRLHRAVRQVLATTLQSLGRDEESLVLLGALRDETAGSDCEKADLLTNIGWGLLLAREAGGAPRGEPVPPLEEALALYRGVCASPDDEANVLVNLALAELHAGRAGAAAARLREARHARPEPGARLALWWLDLEGRIHLAAGQARQARQRFARLAELAEASASPEARWRAAFGQAQAAEQLGDVRTALAAHARAEALLDGEALRVPLMEGRHVFLRERERGSRAYVALAVRTGHVTEALEAARRARARVLEAVRLSDRVTHLPAAERARWDTALAAYRQEREALDEEAARDWRLSTARLAEVRQARRLRDERLRALLEESFTLLVPAASATRSPQGTRPRPAPGELWLVYYPAPRGWIGFAAAEHTVKARFLEPVAPGASPEVLAATLLEPFREELLAARRVTLVPYGVLRAVDFHALPFGADALVAGRPVAYALDLARPEPAEAAPRERTALIVADPEGNLPQAREEARLVHAALREDWQVQVQSGPAATGAGVRAALERAELFHYAGHGRFAGLGGWESVMPLHEGQLTVGDVLALRRVPSWVVLSGCETVLAAQDSPVEGLGLAQAFLAAGAHGAVAAWREVDDAHAMELMRALYRHDGPFTATGLPEALRHAQLELRARRPESDWAAFRALVP
ncbi:CHAT domain-containing protein [Pyxidicoccus xibeiensis]|uniref:CHAT domain-containing protein n=1 Tax=Pyxidicoccus xibeiensis TaxID=2906759 RepID=UPI0020A77457|nr:CHAT domain-containing protein [Pyxidicoccus xibeiensis]MCP3137816.1 CHAT domain-containing protein [Pyxidicoccus xibeiensis]